MGGMTGFPWDKAWAKRMFEEQGGRPHRTMVLCLLAGEGEDAWRGRGRAWQEKAMSPFLLEGEYLRFSRDGEAFIVVGDGLKVSSGAAGASLDELKAARAARAHWADVRGKLTREAYAQAYAQASLDFGQRYVELEHLVLERALKPGASAQEVRLAMNAFKDWKDRHMGKPVAPTEDVTARPSEISDFVAVEAPSVLPLSASWTVESVAEEQRLLLEAGGLDGGEG